MHSIVDKFFRHNALDQNSFDLQEIQGPSILKLYYLYQGNASEFWKTAQHVFHLFNCLLLC